MSFHLSFVTIDGDRLDKVPDMLTTMKYKVQGEPQIVGGDQLDKTMDAIESDRKRLAKVAFLYQGRTHLFDTELVLWDDEAWKTFSKTLDCRIFGYIAVFDPPTYGFNIFGHGKLTREVLSAGDQLDLKGDAIPEEKGVDWKKVTDDAFEAFVHRAGSVFYLPEDKSIKYHVWSVTES